jgi:hypothetical protein
MEQQKFVDIQIIKDDGEERGLIYVPYHFLGKRCKITLEIIDISLLKTED